MLVKILPRYCLMATRNPGKSTVEVGSEYLIIDRVWGPSQVVFTPDFCHQQVWRSVDSFSMCCPFAKRCPPPQFLGLDRGMTSHLKDIIANSFRLIFMVNQMFEMKAVVFRKQTLGVFLPSQWKMDLPWRSNFLWNLGIFEPAMLVYQTARRRSSPLRLEDQETRFRGLREQLQAVPFAHLPMSKGVRVLP